MSTYTTYFIHGLQKYCNGFPSDSDLPSHLHGLHVGTEWANALRINYNSDAVEEKETPLRSVFEFLKTGKALAVPFGYYPLSIDKQYVFPEGEKGDFDDLVAGFKSEWPNLLKLKQEAFGDTLIFLSKKYFSNAGFSPQFPHISLFEHLKTTAALADCLERSENRQILFVCAGLDNIQGFCYDIVSSKAAKSLKGRSFFLQMLLDTIAAVITSDMQINAGVGHVVYARGGKIFLLLPDSTNVRLALDKMKTDLNAEIWQRYRSSLFMFLKYESFAEMESDLSMVWQRLQENIRIDKQQKNLLMLGSEYVNLFEPIEEGFKTGDSEGEKQFCRVTGELIVGANRRKHNIEAGPDEPPVWVQSSVKFQAELGEALREAKEYIKWKSKSSHQIEGDNPIFTGSKTWLTVPEEGQWLLRNAKPLKNDFEPQFRLKLNNLDFLPASPNGTGYGFAFYGGNEQALYHDGTRVKFFSELAGDDAHQETGEGFVRLGVGRMDVDGMGKMAAAAESSFALNATFSSRLDLFLSGYVNSLRANHPDYTNYLNIVFSGGDDLLLIGRWDLTLDFIASLRNDFDRFLGGDFLTMSAGLVLVTPKFPIAKAVELAGKGEDEAKKFNAENLQTGLRPIAELPAKNALCFLGEVISWEKEFDFVVYFSKKLLQWLEVKDKDTTGISMSLIFKIYRFYEMQQDGRLDWRWLSAWYFQQCEKGNGQSKAIFNCLKIFVVSGVWNLQEPDEQARFYKFPPERALMLLSIGGRIADFKNRKNKNSKLKI